MNYRPRVHPAPTRMADVVNETAASLNESAQNATTKTPATPEGMAVAYGSLVFMALLPIFFGSFRSVRYHREQKVRMMLFSEATPSGICLGIYKGPVRYMCHM